MLGGVEALFRRTGPQSRTAPSNVYGLVGVDMLYPAAAQRWFLSESLSSYSGSKENNTQASGLRIKVLR